MEVSKRPIKILCVDDEQDLLHLFRQSIDPLGYEVLTAPSVEQAIPLIEKHASHLALILSDYSMATQNGFDLRRQMLAEHANIPFVLTSGNISREVAMEASELNISAFLPKPFDDEALLQTLSKQSQTRVASILEDDELKDGFINDANQLLADMETALLEIEKNPTDTQLLNRIFAAAHTIKGASGFFKPNTIHQFMHKYEDYLSTFKNGRSPMTSDAVQTLLLALDKLRGLLDALHDPSRMEPLESLSLVFQKPTENKLNSSAPQTIPASGSTPSPSPKAVEELRVAVATLNSFMEKSGEITVLRNMVNKVFATIESQYENDSNVVLLADLMTEMHKSISTMQDQITDLKKVSATQITKPLYRTIRDLSINLKKTIHFEVLGDQLRIDHCLCEILSKCLIHLIRNSADHGIGTEGTISLEFLETTEDIVIRLRDDGRGLDPKIIRTKAIDKGILTHEQASTKTDHEIQMLIFEPGFSTSEKVTDVSGRGVGMDMVNTAIANAGGKIELKSAVGIGTEFTIHLPIPKSVLIINSVLVRHRHQTYALPQDNVDRIFDMGHPGVAQNIKTVGDQLFYMYQGQLEPVIHLNTLLPSSAPSTGGPEGFILRLRSQQSWFCILVDEVVGTEDTVVKPVAPWFSQLSIYKGATFLGDGKIGLILNVDGIAEKLRLGAKAPIVQNPLPKMQILVFAAGRTTCAIAQTEIFRIEKISSQDVRYIGNQALVLYRQRALPLIDLRSLVSECPPKDSLLPDKLDVIITKHGSSLAGYIVSGVEELIEIDTPTTPAFFTNENAAVHIVHNRAITFLDFESIQKKAFQTGRS